jgi:hypothetical protein
MCCIGSLLHKKMRFSYLAKPGSGSDSIYARTTGVGCDIPITTAKECEETSLRYRRDKIYPHKGYTGQINSPGQPIGCFHNKWDDMFAFNVFQEVKKDGTRKKRRQQGVCKTSTVCICKALHFAKCPPNTWSQGGWDAKCHKCSPGKYTIINKPRDSPHKCTTAEIAYYCEPGFGFEHEPELFVSVGNCQSHMTTKEECEKAAEYNKKYGLDSNNGFAYELNPKKMDTYKKDQLLVNRRPRGCYKSTGNDKYYFNPNEDSDKTCNFAKVQCICNVKNDRCIKCPEGTFSKGGVNVKCKQCLSPRKTNEARTTCINTVFLKSYTKMNDQYQKVLKTMKRKFHELTNNIEKSFPDALAQNMATLDTYKDYNNRVLSNKKKFQQIGEKECKKKGNQESRIQVIAALPIHTVLTKWTCLQTNQKELISAFCNFVQTDFDELVLKTGIKKSGKTFWPNICCAGPGKKCQPTPLVKEIEMVPSALSKGGAVTYDSLYAEMVNILRHKEESKKRGYLLQGMLDVFNEIKDTHDDLKEEVKVTRKKFKKLFKKIHLCEPRILKSPIDESINMCELFYPYNKLMNTFQNEINELFKRKETNLIVQKAKEVDKKIDFVTTSKSKWNNDNNICDLPLGGNDDVKEKKKEYCQLYHPFDETDERIVNVAILSISEDFGNKETQKQIINSKMLKFVASDKCYPNNEQMISANSFSMQNINVGKKKSTVLVIKLNSSPNGYLRTRSGTCNNFLYLPRATITFGIYLDNAGCCESEMKDLESCQRCSPEVAPRPLDHHWTKKKLFYELIVTGNTFRLEPDESPILDGTKRTYLFKKNEILPLDHKAGKKIKKSC